MTIRAKFFWLLAKLKNKSIITHLNDLKSGYNQEISEKKLKEFLDFSVSNSPYYNEYKGYKNITDFPIMNKNNIKENYEKLKTPLMKDTDHIMQTSGSSGVPFKIHQNIDKRNRVIAEIIYYNTLANYKLGTKLFFLKNFDDNLFTYFKNLYVKNMVNIDVKNLNDEEIMKIYKKLIKKEKVNILGYASAIERIGLYIKNNNLKIKNNSINSIISTSDLLTEKNKSIWKNLAGVDIVSRYSNQENGFLAQSLDNEDFYKLNHSSYYFEFINLESDKNAEPGERARIVLTDLYNKSIPLIRYDTGDIGIYSVNSEGEKALNSLEGRLRDYILDTEGNLISPSVITKMMWDFYDISGFQFIQKDSKNYILKIIDNNKQYKDMEFIDKLKIYLGKDSLISIERVQKLEALPSGKLQLVKNEYKNL